MSLSINNMIDDSSFFYYKKLNINIYFCLLLIHNNILVYLKIFTTIFYLKQLPYILSIYFKDFFLKTTIELHS